MIQILLIEDDPELNEIITVFLKRNGYRVLSALDVNEAWDLIYEAKPQLIISDIMMPGVNGFEFVRMFREEDRNTPILFISARDDMEAKTKGFHEGIDDYMIKPLNLDELLLRISALLRRSSIKETHRIKIGDFLMDEDEHAAYLSGEEIKLTKREFDILFKLLSYPRKTFTRDSIMSEFWSLDSEATLRTVDVLITRIREKTEKVKVFDIVTVHGLGYKAIIK